VNAYELSILTVIAINVMLALSLNVITGFCGQISLGHAAFFGAGAYAAAFVALHGGNFAAALLAGVAVAAILGVIVGVASLRVRGDFLAVTTIGVGFLFTGFVRKQRWLGAELGLSNMPSSGLGPVGNAIVIGIFAALTIALSLYLSRSWMGFAFAAVRDDEDAAATIGISPPGFKLAAFGIGCAIAGLAGACYAYFTQFVSVDEFGFIVSVTLLAMVVIGGRGSTWGVVLAAAILTVLPEAFRFVNDYRLLVYGGLLALAMRFAPNGLASVFVALRMRMRSA